MPLITIHLVTGKTEEYKKAVMDGVHHALVKAFGIPDSDRLQCLLELPTEHFQGLDYMQADRVVISVRAFSGRSKQVKAMLYQQIIANLGQAPGIRAQDIFIVVEDIPKENWGIRGGQSSLQK
jgi:phenylpyruvate tautomerase PptA (4-oxalocrotonate tautomerase family)